LSFPIHDEWLATGQEYLFILETADMVGILNQLGDFDNPARWNPPRIRGMVQVMLSMDMVNVWRI
jgi:hypothetical protein